MPACKSFAHLQFRSKCTQWMVFSLRIHHSMIMMMRLVLVLWPVHHRHMCHEYGINGFYRCDHHQCMWLIFLWIFWGNDAVHDLEQRELVQLHHLVPCPIEMYKLRMLLCLCSMIWDPVKKNYKQFKYSAKHLNFSFICFLTCQ